MPKGLLITFEGIDGCGKSTQTQLASAALEKAGVPCLVTREPGGTAIGEKIRALLLDTENHAMCAACETLLYLAARAQHVTEKIVPAVERGVVVLCDRFTDATIAYQGYGRGIDIDTLAQLNAYAIGSMMPNLSFIFDISVDEAFQRMRRAKKMPDRLETSGRPFLEAVRVGYLALAQQWPGRIRVINGSDRPERLAEITFIEINRLLEKQTHDSNETCRKEEHAWETNAG